MTPNQVTAIRVAAAFGAVALFLFFGDVMAVDLAGVALTVAAIVLDGVDGYLARSRGMATPLGAQLDIMGDRVVENLFFTFFAVAGLVSLWVPVVFFVRGTLTDFLRGLASRAGRSGFGQSSMLETTWGRALVASRSSRSTYAALKCLCFCFLGFTMSVGHAAAPWLDGTVRGRLLIAAQALVTATVVFCLVRAIPVILDGRKYWAKAVKATAARQQRSARAAVEAAR